MKTNKLFHRTTTDAARSILAHGFIDDFGDRVNKSEVAMCQAHRGVFLSDIPVNIQDGASGDVLLELAFDREIDDLSEAYEFQCEPDVFCPFREFLIPASFVNTHAMVRQIDEPELEELELWACDMRLQRANEFEGKGE